MSDIFKQFLQWNKTASLNLRLEALDALVKAYLFSNLSREDMEAAEATITVMLRDPAIEIRKVIANACASNANAAKHIIISLVHDVPEVSAIVIERSPLLQEAELVDIVAEDNVYKQIALTRRSYISFSVAAALCEIGHYNACISLAYNLDANITPSSFKRLYERFNCDAALREALLARDDLPMGIRYELVQNMNSALSNLMLVKSSATQHQLFFNEKYNQDRLTLKLAETANVKELTELVIYLRDTNQLTTELLLRGVCLGNLMFFEIALADLANQPLTRVVALVEGRSRNAFRALCKKAGLPLSSWNAFEIAVDIWHQTVVEDHPYEKRFVRKMIERVLTKYESEFSSGDLDSLLAMLRRLATDIAYEDAEAYIENNLSAA